MIEVNRSLRPSVDISVNVARVPIDVAHQIKALERQDPEAFRDLVVHAIRKHVVGDHSASDPGPPRR